MISIFCDKRKRNRAIVPGRSFTRRMYAKFLGSNLIKGEKMLKAHHHVKLDREFKLDCQMWKFFLQDLRSVIRPFIDLEESISAETLNFFSDASANEKFGYGAIFGDNWLFGQWEEGFIKTFQPSIETLELFALCAAIFTWQEHEQLNRTRIVIHCDNMLVVQMVNNTSSSCHQCMKLIRLLTLNNLKHDRRLFIRHVEGRKNSLSDALSRINLKKFFELAPLTVNQFPDKISEVIWPYSKIWLAETLLDINN